LAESSMTETCSQQLAANARRCREQLTDEAAAEIAAFVMKQQNPDGGFRGRSTQSDLYYTQFALEALCALEQRLPVEGLRAFLVGFGRGDGLDFVHLACLLRCWGRMTEGAPAREVLDRVDEYRTPDGGYHGRRNARKGSPYGCYLALLAYEGAGVPLPGRESMARCLHACKPANTPTAAALSVLLAHLEGGGPAALGDWLLARASKRGGFAPSPLVPVPDLLSTATALHALTVLGRPLEALRRPCREFVTGLWAENGGFCGHWADRTPDCEYTYYALLALGCLA